MLSGRKLTEHALDMRLPVSARVRKGFERVMYDRIILADERSE